MLITVYSTQFNFIFFLFFYNVIFSLNLYFLNLDSFFQIRLSIILVFLIIDLISYLNLLTIILFFSCDDVMLPKTFFKTIKIFFLFHLLLYSTAKESFLSHNLLNGGHQAENPSTKLE